MIQIVWEFRVRAESVDEFVRHYRSEGSWAKLFRRGAGYGGTALLRDQSDPLRYLTIDTWEDGAAFAEFQRQFAGEYKRLDTECEGLTMAESKLGVFEVL